MQTEIAKAEKGALPGNHGTLSRTRRKCRGKRRLTRRELSIRMILRGIRRILASPDASAYEQSEARRLRDAVKAMNSTG